MMVQQSCVLLQPHVSAAAAVAAFSLARTVVALVLVAFVALYHVVCGPLIVLCVVALVTAGSVLIHFVYLA